MDNGAAVELQAASYEGSAPFSGIFSIFDCDLSVYQSPESGKRIVSAHCHVGNSNDEDDTIELEILGTLTANFIEGYSGDVIDRIEWVE